jgi:hypothetical protein
MHTPTATPKEPRPAWNGANGDGSDGGKNKAAEAYTGGKEMGRPPADEPDVYVLVPDVHVGKLTIDVQRLDADLALRAQVANLVTLMAGVHVGVDRVNVVLEDVDAECELQVRLHNTYNILDRTLTSLDENPEIVQGLLETAGSVVQETGEIGREATKPGGALAELSRGIGGTLGSVADKANPTKHASGAPGSTLKKARGVSNGSRRRKAAIVTGVAGTAGLVGGTLFGKRGSRGLFGIGR